MWTTVPQLIYYRLRAWNVVSTPSRASNLLLKRYLAQTICTSLCFRTTLIANAAPPPRKGRDSVKLTALNTVIPENTHQMEALETIQNTQMRTRNKTEDKRNRASRRMKQEETQK